MWEYKRFTGSCETSIKNLNDLGKEGWELVTVMYAQFSDYAHYLFKRPLKK